MSKPRMELKDMVAGGRPNTATVNPAGFDGGFSLDVLGGLQQQSQTPEQQIEIKIDRENSRSYLTIPGTKRRVAFTDIYIRSDKIHEVLVAPENVRHHESLTAEDVSDIKDNIELFGIYRPLLAFFRDGHYEVFDGSRRLFCAKLLGVGVTLRVLDPAENLTPAELSKFSLVENLSLVLSIWEIGKVAQQLVDQRNAEIEAFRAGATSLATAPMELTTRMLAVICGKNQALVALGLRAIRVDAAVYRMFPHGVRIGRPRVKSVVSLWESLTIGQQQSLVEQIGNTRCASDEEAQRMLQGIAAGLVDSNKEIRKEQECVGNYTIKRVSAKTIQIVANSKEELEALLSLVRAQGYTASTGVPE